MLRRLFPAVQREVVEEFRHTFALIKPDLTCRPVEATTVLSTLESGELGLEIVSLAHKHMSVEEAEAFYAVHKGKFFAPRLIAHMSSGPVVALILRSTQDHQHRPPPSTANKKSGKEEPSINTDAITAWRNAIGPTRIQDSVVAACLSDAPSDVPSLRSQYALSDTRNAFHGADSPQAVLAEAAHFFPPSLLPSLPPI